MVSKPRSQKPKMETITSSSSADDGSSSTNSSDDEDQSHDEEQKETEIMDTKRSAKPNEDNEQEGKEVTTDATIQSLQSLITILSQPETLLHSIILPPPSESLDKTNSINDNQDQKQRETGIQSLYQISKQLFAKCEQLALWQEQLSSKDSKDVDQLNDSIEEKDEEEEACLLSGLTELYTGMENHDITGNDRVDVETIWGQVELQNASLVKLVSKSIKKLEKKVTRDTGSDNLVRLLDMDGLNSDEDGDGEEEDMKEDEEEEEDDDNDDVEDDEEGERIRKRMERAMADMDDEQGDDDDDDNDVTSKREPNDSKNEVIDPAAEELNDGFFDLHDMEDFADEEEEMLPEEAYGEPTPDDDNSDGENDTKNRKKTLPHLRGRFGQDEDDDEDADFSVLEKKVEPTVRRRRYRDDEDVEALQELYQEARNDDDDYEDNNVVNMSAVDFFGKPSKRHLQKEKKKGNDSSTRGRKAIPIDDDGDKDSWDEHEFGEEGENWRDDDNEERLDLGHNNDMNEENESEEDKEDFKNDRDNDGEENEEGPKKLSTYGTQSKKLDDLTEQLEKEALAERPWQMVGESKGSERPTNSLLEGTPEFEVATKMAPTITIEHTISIEEMIKKRIIDEDWDDVIPRDLPDILGGRHNDGELPEVSQEKSKLGLGELYEREYLKKATGYDKDATEKQTEEDKAKSEMKMIFANVCSKLDALSNYHFAPRPVADEVEVKPITTPAIAMEEVLPLHISDARASAPEEIYGAKKGREGVIRGETEMDQAERKRLRQAKKASRRKARKSKLADEKLISKLQPGLGLNNPYEKRKMREELQSARASGKVVSGERDNADKDYKTSAKFFQRMQDDVQKTVRGDGDDTGSRKKRKKFGFEDHGKISSSFKL